MLKIRSFKISFIVILSILLISCREYLKEVSLVPKVLPIKKEVLLEPVLKLPRIGSISELGNDSTCKEFGNILAYAKTLKYHIYVCGNETINQPKSMIIFTVVGNSYKAIIYDNPSISWRRSYTFIDGEFGVGLSRPSTLTSYDSHVPELPIFYLSVNFANEQFINEKIHLYLFNEKIDPNYKRVMLQPDKKAGERFLEYSPTPQCQRLGKNGISPKLVKAYEITPRKYLVEMTCFLPQYNGEYQYILYSEEDPPKKIKIIPFKTLISPESGEIKIGEKLTISGLPQFFPEDNTLRVFHKGIGAGGCGYASEYKLIGERFELLEFRKYDCFGSKSPKDWKSKSPSEFPKIYP